MSGFRKKVISRVLGRIVRRAARRRGMRRLIRRGKRTRRLNHPSLKRGGIMVS